MSIIGKQMKYVVSKCYFGAFDINILQFVQYVNEKHFLIMFTLCLQCFVLLHINVSTERQRFAQTPQITFHQIFSSVFSARCVLYIHGGSGGTFGLNRAGLLL